jgi:hypothetical protein
MNFFIRDRETVLNRKEQGRDKCSETPLPPNYHSISGLKDFIAK